MKPCKRLDVLLLVSALLLTGTASAADDNPVHPYVAYKFMWDSNIFRLSGKDEALAQLGSGNMGTAVQRVDAGMDTDFPISRQHLVAQLNVNRNQYEQFRFLDYTGHDALVRWDWAGGRLWSGDLGYSHARTLASYTQFQRPVQNLQTRSNRFFDMDYSFMPHWHVRGGISRYEVSYTAQALRISNVNLNTVKAGVDFVSNADNTLGIELKATDGHYPDRQVVATSVVDNSYRQTEVAAVTSWVYSANTRITGKVGYVHRAYHQLSVRDFSGLVGRATAYWHVAGSTLLRLSAWRRISAYQNLLSSYLINNGASVDPTWTVTPKITIKGQLLYQSLTYKGDPGFLLTQTPVRKDKLHGAMVDVSYKPFEHLTVGASYQWRYRTSNYSSHGYRDNTVNAHLRFEFM